MFMQLVTVTVFLSSLAGIINLLLSFGAHHNATVSIAFHIAYSNLFHCAHKGKFKVFSNLNFYIIFHFVIMMRKG